MILVDANLLVYAHVESFPQHAPSRDWLDVGPASESVELELGIEGIRK